VPCTRTGIPLRSIPAGDGCVSANEKRVVKMCADNDIRERNAIELIKESTQELNNYRKRKNYIIITYLAMCFGILTKHMDKFHKIGCFRVVVVGALIVISGFAVYLIHETRKRGRHVKGERQKIINELSLPENLKVQLNIDVKDSSAEKGFGISDGYIGAVIFSCIIISILIIFP
jgi:hypothetical protein